jgi:Pyruvate/2-oxoacid:ferredoxin oxidoreductase delta subunit
MGVKAQQGWKFCPEKEGLHATKNKIKTWVASDHCYFYISTYSLK